MSRGRCPVELGTAALAASCWREIAATGELQVQGCADCGSAQFPPRLRCGTCGSASLEWWGAGPSGELTSIVVVAGMEPRHRPARTFRELDTYGTGIVAPDDRPDVRIAAVLLADDVTGPDAHALGRVALSVQTWGGAPTPVATRIGRR